MPWLTHPVWVRLFFKQRRQRQTKTRHIYRGGGQDGGRHTFNVCLTFLSLSHDLQKKSLTRQHVVGFIFLLMVTQYSHSESLKALWLQLKVKFTIF